MIVEDYRGNRQASSSIIDYFLEQIRNTDIGSGEMVNECGAYQILRLDNGEYLVLPEEVAVKKFEVDVEIHYTAVKKIVINADNITTADDVSTMIPSLAPNDIDWNDVKVGVREVRQCRA